MDPRLLGQSDPSTQPAPKIDDPAPAAVPPTPSDDAAALREQLAALQRERDMMAQGLDYARQQFEAIAPFERDLEWLRDENNRKVFEASRRAYEAEANRVPDLDPATKYLDEKIEKRFSRYDKYIETQEQAMARAAREQQESWIGENRKFAERLKAEFKFSDADVADLASYADYVANTEVRRPFGLEEAYRRQVGRYNRDTKPTPAPVLRADSGTPGIPEKRAVATNERWTKDFHGAMVDTIREAQKGRSA